MTPCSWRLRQGQHIIDLCPLPLPLVGVQFAQPSVFTRAVLSDSDASVMVMRDNGTGRTWLCTQRLLILIYILSAPSQLKRGFLQSALLHNYDWMRWNVALLNVELCFCVLASVEFLYLCLYFHSFFLFPVIISGGWAIVLLFFRAAIKW